MGKLTNEDILNAGMKLELGRVICYIDPSNPPKPKGSIKMKKHRSKKWKNGRKK